MLAIESAAWDILCSTRKNRNALRLQALDHTEGLLDQQRRRKSHRRLVQQSSVAGHMRERAMASEHLLLAAEQRQAGSARFP